jgi:hypothetical protein
MEENVRKKNSEGYINERDEYISESGIQGGKVIGEKLALGSLILGIPLFVIGIFSLLNMLLGFGFPVNDANIIAVLLAIVIGLLLIFGGCTIHKIKSVKK